MDSRSGFRIAAVVAVVALAVSCSSGESGEDTQSPDSTASAPNPGLVFEGTYAAKQVQEVRPDVPPIPVEYQNTIMSVKSFCANDSGPCVASAMTTYPDVVPPPTPQPLVLDYVDGQWVLNLEAPGVTCATEDGVPLEAPHWQVAAFEQPEGIVDGSVITGTGTLYGGPPCAKQYSTTYTFTRTGPLDPALTIPPPGDVPPLVEAGGSALSGNYDFELTPLSSTDNLSAGPVSAAGSYQSFCARTGDACVSVFDGESEVLPMLEWSGETWSSDATSAPAACSKGSGTQKTTIRTSLTREDSGTGPAQSLSGETRKTYVGDCPGEVAWTIAATRTGD